MGKIMPVGTMRKWEQGWVIKCYEGGKLQSPWIPVPENATITNIGIKCDALVREITSMNIPISGEKYLDYEIKNFKKTNPDADCGKYHPNDFKQYSGFSGAGAYSFRNEFTKRWMQPKIDLHDEINSALWEENERLCYEKKPPINPTENDLLTAEDRRRIRQEVRNNFVPNSLTISIEEAEELYGIVKRVYRQMKQGVDFKGEEKKVYEGCVEVANSLPKIYTSFKKKLEEKNAAENKINETFSDNWAIKESFKDYINEKFSELCKKYKKEIAIDAAEEHGIDIEGSINGFYNSLHSIDDKSFPYADILNIRFNSLYEKRVEGEWDSGNFMGLKVFEELLKKVPQGHILTNKELKELSVTNFSREGYAFYSPTFNSITFSREAASAASLFGALTQRGEFESTLTHEIGHAVSQKLGRSDDLDYKKFVVQCGWSYQDKETYQHSTDGDKKIPRRGSNSNIPLLTEYAHQAPEEAFAEYYSIYQMNKKEIDKWLESKESKYLKKTKAVLFPTKELNITVDKVWKGEVNIPQVRVNEADLFLNRRLLEKDEHIKVELIDPFYADLTKEERRNLDLSEKVKWRKDWNYEHMPPVISIKENAKECTILDGANRQVQAKVNHQPLPSITITRECYQNMLQGGFSKEEIQDYCVHISRNKKIPYPIGEPQTVHGLEYRGRLLSESDVKRNYQRFEKLKNIYDSKKIEKALMDLKIGFDEGLVSEDKYLEVLGKWRRVGDEDVLIKGDKRNVFADAIIVNDKNKVLLLLRSSDTDFKPRYWGLPGGRVDEGESIEDGVRRETLEECNLEIKECKEVLEKEVESGVIHYFSCKVDEKESIEVISDEHFNLKWCSRDEWMDMELLPGLKEVLNEVVPEEEVILPVNPKPNLFQQTFNFIKKAFNKGEIGEDKYLKALDLVEKARKIPLKYYKREGVKGNYKYFYTKEEWEKEHGKKEDKRDEVPQSTPIHPVIEQLQQLAGLTNGEQSKYFQSRVERAKPIEVGLIKDILTKEQLKKIENFSAETKQCYMNAAKITQTLPECKYVEGQVMIFNSLPIEHAWNEIDGKYFDITAELALEGKSEMSDYVSMFELSNKEVLQMMVETEMYGDWYPHYYRTRIRENEVKKALDVIKEGFNQGLISEERYFEALEKARMTGQIGETRTWQGKKYQKQANGKWVPVSEGRKKGKEEESKGKNKANPKEEPEKKHTEEELKEFAKKAPESALQKTIKESGDEVKRKIANEELKRRGVEEKGETKKEAREPKKEEISDKDRKKAKVQEKIKRIQSLFKQEVEESMKDENILDDKKASQYNSRITHLSRYQHLLRGGLRETNEKFIERFKKENNIDDLEKFFGDGEILYIGEDTTKEVEVITEDAFFNRDFKERKGKKIVDMSLFILDPLLEKGEGKGTSIFYNQVKNFKEAGYEELSTFAAKGSDFNGYYTWARLGYRMSSVTENLLKNELVYDEDENEERGAERFKVLQKVLELSGEKSIDKVSQPLHYLMSFKEGREWWKKNGFEFQGYFDLEDDSVSMKILEEYVKNKEGEMKNNS